MKHNINPLIHPNLLNDTFRGNTNTNKNILTQKKINNISRANGTPEINKNLYRKFGYNVVIPVIIIIVISFILKQRMEIKPKNTSLKNN